MDKLFATLALTSAILFTPHFSEAQSRRPSYNDQLREGVRRGEISREEARDMRREKQNIRNIQKIASKEGKLSRKEKANLRREKRLANREASPKKEINEERYNKRYNARFSEHSSSGRKRAKGRMW